MKTKNFVFCIFLSLFFFASCTNTQYENEQASIEFSVENFVRDEVSTRTAITLPDNDVDPAGFIWTAGDTIGIAPSEGSQVYFVINEGGANTTSATFSGGAWALKPADESDYAAYYPFIGDIYLDRTTIPVNYEGQIYSPAQDNVLASLASYDYMAAKPSKASSSDNVSFHFSHLGSLVEFQLSIPKEAAVKSVTITAPSAIFALDGYYDLTSETVSIQPDNKSLVNTFTVTVEDLTVQAGEKFSVFCMMCPIDISEVDLTAKITYGNGETKKSFLNRGKNMQAGRWYTLDVDEIEYIEYNEDFKENLESVLRSSLKTKLRFVSKSIMTSETLVYSDGARAYAVENGEWLEIHTKANEYRFGNFDYGAFWVKNGSSPLYNIEELDLRSFNTSDETDMSRMFEGCVSLKSVDLSSFNTEKVRDMSSMFSGCRSLLDLNLDSFNAPNVCEMQYMFDGCSLIKSLDLSRFGTAGYLTNISYMCYGCESLTSLNLKNFNTSRVTEMLYVFGDCSSLNTLDLSGFNTAEVTKMSGMFKNCNQLDALDLSTFSFAKVGSPYFYNMFSDVTCPIYVANTSDKTLLQSKDTGAQSSQIQVK